jgi:hypothetical protein
MTKPSLAASKYRQLRLTATHELGGRFSYSIYAKRLNDRWDEHSCIYRDNNVLTDKPLKTTVDVVAVLLEVLADQLLPSWQRRY